MVSDRYYLLLTTSLVKWIINIYYLIKRYNEKEKTRQYQIEIDNTHRFTIKIKYLCNLDKFESEIISNKKVIASIFFDNPIQWCEQVFDMSTKDAHVYRFVKILLTCNR